MSDYQNYVGRIETLSDVVSASALDRFAATLETDAPPYKAGDSVPPLGHWLYFLPQDRQSTLGADGHLARGGFLPPVHDLPRRMWAGSRMSFNGPLQVGMALEKRSTIIKISEKQGRSGRLVFATVRHEIGEAGAPPLVTDEHDIVYRGLNTPAVGQAPEPPTGAVWKRALVPDETLLFRYSALTFNAHRIHYDADYVRDVEGYPGLIVHGPLTATLMIDLLRRNMPDAQVLTYNFRAASPVFAGNQLTICGIPPSDDGVVRLWAQNHEGGLAMSGEATIR